MAGLLDPLAQDQQKLVDLVAEAFALDNEWPVFDYLEPRLIKRQECSRNACELPSRGRWNYGSVWWVGLGQMSQPTAETEVALTLVGMHHSNVLQPFVDVFFDGSR